MIALKQKLQPIKEKNTFRLWLGLAMIIIALTWPVLSYHENGETSVFDWIYTAVFLLNGVLNTYEGKTGRPISRIFGKAFIDIDDSKISIKPSPYFKGHFILWSNISSITYSDLNLVVEKTKNEFEKINLSRLDYIIIQDIKETLKNLAEKKNKDFIIK